MEPNDKDTYNNLPWFVQRRVFIDWRERARLGTLRGEGLYSHAGYLDMIGQEMGLSVEEVLDLDYFPV